jgi:hypothetical protein
MPYTPFVRGTIDQARATVKTDGWSGYGDLRQHGAKHGAPRPSSSAFQPSGSPFAQRAS